MNAGTLWDEIRQLMVVYEPPRLTQVKLTREQFEVLCANAVSPSPEWAQPVSGMLGIPVVLVDKVEESTPFLEGWLSLTGGLVVDGHPRSYPEAQR